MSYCPYQKNCDPTMMIATSNNLPHNALTSYPDRGASYKNLMMYPSWQWPPTPEGIPPPFRLPPIHAHRFTPMQSIPSPMTPGTLTSHHNMHSVEPLSPVVQPPCPPSFPSTASPSAPPIAAHSPKDNTLTSTPTGSKRGRPRADVISSLQYYGSNSTCSIRCHICHRVFPREKSLQAHLRTHTGERPYRCDYPNCTKSFVQSGQLKTHQRLHSGEKPFKCSGEACTVRFTHANRHCPDHPHAKLLRDDQGALEGLLVGTPRHDSAIAEWLDKYVRSRLDRNNSAQRPCLKKESPDQISSDDEVRPHRVETMLTKNELSKNSLSVELRGSTVKRQLLSDENVTNFDTKIEEHCDPVVRIPLSPKRINQNGQVLKIDPRHPMKKRILAYNQMLMKEKQEKLSNGSVSTLQRPILPPVDKSPRRKLDIENSPEAISIRSKVIKNTPPKKYSYLKDLESPHTISLNGLSSPSRASDRTSPLKHKVQEQSEPSERWNGALALMQLASSPPSRKFSQQSN